MSPEESGPLSMKHFAQEVIEECAAFPHGEYDDYVDSTSQALLRLRGSYFVTHPEDYKDKKIERGNELNLLWLEDLQLKY